MIYRIDNILDDEFRKRILERSKEYLMTLDDFHRTRRDTKLVDLPGKQTPPDLHIQLTYGPPLLSAISKSIGINFTIKKSWVNWTNGDKREMCWHTHDSDYAGVWYLKTPVPFFSNGTIIEDKFYRAPQNSLLLFPGHMKHTAPSSPLRLDRYTLGMDLMRR